MFDDAFCCGRTNALHEAAARVLFQSGERGRFGFMGTDDLVLTTGLRVLLPEARQSQRLASMNIGESANDGDQFALPRHVHSGNLIDRFFTVES
jgi:hypothetical protein